MTSRNWSDIMDQNDMELDYDDDDTLSVEPLQKLTLTDYEDRSRNESPAPFPPSRDASLGPVTSAPPPPEGEGEGGGTTFPLVFCADSCAVVAVSDHGETFSFRTPFIEHHARCERGWVRDMVCTLNRLGITRLHAVGRRLYEDLKPHLPDMVRLDFYYRDKLKFDCLKCKQRTCPVCKTALAIRHYMNEWNFMVDHEYRPPNFLLF